MKIEVAIDGETKKQVFRLIFKTKDDYDNLYNALSQIVGLLKQNKNTLDAYKNF